MMEDSDSKSLDTESNSHDDTPMLMLAATPKASALPPPTSSTSPSSSKSTPSSPLPDNTTGLGLGVISSPNKATTIKQESTTTSSSTPNTTSTNSTTPASNHKKKRVRAPPTPIDSNEIRKSGRERKPAPILYENAAQKEELSDHLRYHSRLPSKKKREAAKKAAQEAKRASSGSKKKKKNSTTSSSEEESGSESEEETPKKKKPKTTPKKTTPKAAAVEGSHVCIIYHAVDDEETKVFVAPAKKVTPTHTSFLSELHGAGANDDSRRDEFVSLLESVFTQIASMTYGEDTDGPVELNRRISSLYHITFL